MVDQHESRRVLPDARRGARAAQREVDHSANGPDQAGPSNRSERRVSLEHERR